MLHCTPALICCLSTLLKEYLLFLVELDKPADPGKTSCTSCGGPQPIPGDLEQKKRKSHLRVTCMPYKYAPSKQTRGKISYAGPYLHHSHPKLKLTRSLHP